jgi:peptide/nickel transport system substrate-binding protein
VSDNPNYWQARLAGRLSRRRLLVAGAWTAGGAALASACGGARSTSQPTAGTTSAGSAAGAPQPGGTFNWYEIGNPTLNPQTNARYWTQRAAGAVMSRLVRYKAYPDPKSSANREVESDLAVTLESPDGITWTAKLRPGAKFQNVAPVNGRVVEAEDVKATFIAALTNPKNANRESLGMIDETKIEAPSSNTVVFHLKYPYAPFKKTLASPTYSWVFPREAFSDGYDPEKQLIGSGPFLFDSFTPDVAVLYKRNPAWFEQGKPYVDGARYAIIPDTSQQIAQFSSGNLDHITQIEDNDLDSLKRNRPQATLITAPPGVPGWVFGQLGDPNAAWADVRVRRAVSMAIDRDALAKIVAPRGGETQLVVGTSFGNWALKPADLSPDIAPFYKFDPAGAKKLLQAAGKDTFEFRFIYTNNGYGARFNTTAETINGMLSSAGFKTKLVTIDYQREYVGGGKGIRYGSAPPDAMVYGLTSGFDEPDEVLFNYFHSKSALRNTSLSDPALDAMIDKERTTLDENQRQKAVLDIQRYLADKAYLVAGLPTPYAYSMIQPWVYSFNSTTSYGVFTESYASLWMKK